MLNLNMSRVLSLVAVLMLTRVAQRRWSQGKTRIYIGKTKLEEKVRDTRMCRSKTAPDLVKEDTRMFRTNTQQ